MKRVLLVLVVLIAIAAVFIATRPGTFRIERTTTIAAPAPVVYANLADFRRWPQWSPWENRDPQMTREYEGAPSGMGAGYHWSGNDQVGEGRMTIVEAVPPQRLGIRLDFIKPWTATSRTTFALAPEGDATRVTWSMEGENNFMAKAMTTMMSMDKMVGPDFEQGLGRLKAVAEAEAAVLVDTAAASPDTSRIDTTGARQ